MELTSISAVATQVSPPTLSIIVPVFNEQETVSLFLDALWPILEKVGSSYEIIFVNDGSRDQTLSVLLAFAGQNQQIKILNLSRNFGKEYALTAGIEASKGAAVVPMDVDLQDPPEVLLEMIEVWRQGYDVVLAARSDRSDDNWFKRSTARLFYKLMLRISDIEIPADVGDFRLMDRRVVEALKLMPEKTRFMKGMFAWVGFHTKVVYFKRNSRSAGDPKLKIRSLVNLAIEGIVSFTSLPLRLASLVGLLAFGFASIYMLYILLRTLVFGISVPGYASLVVVMLFFSGLNMLCLGIIGEYISRIFLEVKNRPVYLVRDRINFEDQANESV